ncbi:MAG: type II toxin-antitoxin system RelE/ParE family toxin [Chroococcidiopsidaceae cyanobacterium CP_BM_ER_R8_30]|nr:type II toxin-antitoxin system RelE/ParE family toxin [Chroococcidiopsidaceae cyanobacterium CP_BM_ER_R8_30]
MYLIRYSGPMVNELTVKVLELDDGTTPFEEWYRKLSDEKTRQIVQGRLARIRAGNFGDWKSVGSGVFELRIDYGPGYRVYFGRSGTTLVILIAGGDKRTQAKDITFSISIWEDYKDAIERSTRNLW